MTTLKVGIASYEEMKSRTMRIARGEQRVGPGSPGCGLPRRSRSPEVLSAGNRDLLRVIAEKAPASLDELASLTGRKKSNCRGRCETMEGACSWCRLERGERGRTRAEGGV